MEIIKIEFLVVVLLIQKGCNYIMEGLVYDKNAKISIVLLFIIICIYIFGSFYFKTHFFFRTSINGIDISCKTIEEAKNEIYDKVGDFKLVLTGRDDLKDEITSDDIKLEYEGSRKIEEIKSEQNPFLWISALIEKKEYCDIVLFSYDESMLEDKINRLKFIDNDNTIEPENPKFQYTDGSYIILSEVEGNKVDYKKTIKIIKNAIERGIKSIDLDESGCYEKLKFTKESKEVKETKEIIDKYVSSKIVYTFDEHIETVDGSLINKWVDISDDMEADINKELVKEYIEELGKKYNTVGKERNFTSSVGKTVTVKGGYYGWKINTSGEVKALIDNIKHGQSILKEPLYSQKALSRSEDDIGDTYVEVNITRQHVWFYKGGKLVVQGDVVTGCKSKNTPTYLGVYALNYKQKDATLKGNGYSSKVTYWMPFNGNIGLHDASWRSSFGGSIYKNNGTHGCVNMPKYLAKTIYENIDANTPVICYSEETKSTSE